MEIANSLSIDRKWVIEFSRLRFNECISEGSYSLVYEGEFQSQRVALKVINPQRASDVIPEHRVSFQREVALLSRIKHENIVKFIGASLDLSLIVVMELMQGDLQNYLLGIRPRLLDPKIAVSFALDISRAMECLHGKKIIHCDLKPSNLLLTKDKKHVKVAGFGLAREVTDGVTSVAGTRKWMAPELLSGEALEAGMQIRYNHKVDVYSFSIVLWEMLTNEPPFKPTEDMIVPSAAASNDEWRSVEKIPMTLIPLLKSCWAEDPSRRPEFTEITKRLQNFLAKLR